MKKSISKNLKSELDSWICKNKEERARKAEREFARYPRMIKEMGLDLIDTSDKSVLEIGCGPRGLIHLLDANFKSGIDPLADEYKKYYSFPLGGVYIMKGVGENVNYPDMEFDLVVIPNALDHCNDPEKVIEECKRVLKPSGWLAVHNCIDLVTIHPHESHIHNIDYKMFREWVDGDFECYHTLKYPEIRYGWMKGPDGKIGQACFSYLGRIVTKGV